MKKVLIVSYYFPPLNSIAAKRYGLMCKYFKENGYDAYVLTTRINEYRGIEWKNELSSPVHEDSIIRIGRKKIYESKKIFTLFFLHKLLEKYKLSFRTISIDDLLWYENVQEKLNIKDLGDIDIVIGTYGPIGNLYIAKYISRKIKSTYIIDVRDFISEWQEVDEGFKHYSQIDNLIEKKLLSAAQGIIVVTPGIKKIITKKYPKMKVITIFNGWDDIQNKSLNKPKEKYLYSAGSLYEHRMDSFVLLVKVLKRVNEKEDIKLIIRTIGPPKLSDKAKKIVQELGMEDRVSVLPPAPQAIIKKEQSRAYINIVLNSVHENSIGEMGMLPGKTFEFMNESTPILAISPPTSDLGKILSYTNKGVATISEDEIEDFILYSCEKYVGNSNIMKFSRKYQAKKLCRFMDSIL